MLKNLDSTNKDFANSLEDIRHMGYLPIEPSALEELIKALGELNCMA